MLTSCRFCATRRRANLGSMAAALGVIVHFLATHPAVQEDLRTRPGNLAAAIDELLRIDDPFLVNRRVATVATRIADSSCSRARESI